MNEIADALSRKQFICFFHTTGRASTNTHPWDSKRALNAQLQDLMSLALASSTY